MVVTGNTYADPTPLRPATRGYASERKVGNFNRRGFSTGRAESRRAANAATTQGTGNRWGLEQRQDAAHKGMSTILGIITKLGLITAKF